MFIELTELDGHPVLINWGNILTVHPDQWDQGMGAKITMLPRQGDRAYQIKVRETLDQVRAKLRSTG